MIIVAYLYIVIAFVFGSLSSIVLAIECIFFSSLSVLRVICCI